MRALLVHCHPNPDSLVAAARDRALAGLERAGHEIRTTDLYAERFEPIAESLAPDAAGDVEDLRWAELLVLVYPTWWSGQPALLKAWIDDVWGPAAAGSRAPRSSDSPLTGLRHVVVVTTHGSPRYLNRLEGEVGRRTVFRAVRRLAGRRVRRTWLAIYGLDTGAPERRTAWLDEVEERLAAS